MSSVVTRNKNYAKGSFKPIITKPRSDNSFLSSSSSSPAIGNLSQSNAAQPVPCSGIELDGILTRLDQLIIAQSDNNNNNILMITELKTRVDFLVDENAQLRSLLNDLLARTKTISDGCLDACELIAVDTVRSESQSVDSKKADVPAIGSKVSSHSRKKNVSKKVAVAPSKVQTIADVHSDDSSLPTNKYLASDGALLPSLRAAESTKNIFVSNCNKDTTEDDISTYVRSKMGIDANISTRKLVARNRTNSITYISFIVAVPNSSVEVILNPEFWPPGLIVREFFHRNQKN